MFSRAWQKSATAARRASGPEASAADEPWAWISRAWVLRNFWPRRTSSPDGGVSRSCDFSCFGSGTHVSGWPTVYVIDHNGVIRHKYLHGKRLDETLEKLVAEAETAAKTGTR